LAKLKTKEIFPSISRL